MSLALLWLWIYESLHKILSNSYRQINVPAGHEPRGFWSHPRNTIHFPEEHTKWNEKKWRWKWKMATKKYKRDQNLEQNNGHKEQKWQEFAIWLKLNTQRKRGTKWWKKSTSFFFFQSGYFGPLWDECLRGLLNYNLSRPTHVDGFHSIHRAWLKKVYILISKI